MTVLSQQVNYLTLVLDLLTTNFAVRRLVLAIQPGLQVVPIALNAQFSVTQFLIVINELIQLRIVAIFRSIPRNHVEFLLILPAMMMLASQAIQCNLSSL